ncbi:MAG: DegV family protein [Ilumatobacteraceae bacterium]|nr:DegV family protein [Ilumatobacteraceae bacterium]
MIGICTDSNSQLPESLAQRYAVEVVPITVTVDGHEYLEGVDLDADRFYELLATEPRSRVSTSQPSPGQFAAAYETLLQRGCDQIVSIHLMAATSGTLNSARLATKSLPIPVRLVDSGTAGFGISCCVWAAAEAVARGASIDEAVQIAESLSPQISAVFIVGQLDFLHTERALDKPDGIPVMRMHDGALEVVEHVTTATDAVHAMAAAATGWGSRLNVAVGMADRSGERFSQGLAAAIGESPNVVEVVRYRIGPSVGAYAGLGTVGCFMFPAG